MADETKNDLNIDDWDNLPLAPDDDDWDDVPVKVPHPEQTEASLESPSPLPPPPDSAQIFAIFGDPPAADDDFASPPAADDDFASSPAADDDFDDLDNITVDELDQVEAPQPEEAPAPFETANKTNDFPDDNWPDGENVPADETLASLPVAEDLGQPETPALNDEPEIVTTKKVELDIEGIFLDDHDDPEPPAEEDQPLPVPDQVVPAVSAPAPTPTPTPESRKIPKIKLLIVVLPALLLTIGLIYGLYKWLAPAPQAPPAPVLDFDPKAPPRELAPGEINLGLFYINFPEGKNETIVELNVVVYYKDLPNKWLIEEKTSLVRDIIFRSAQGKGSQLVSNGEIQKALRQEAAQQANTALGCDCIDYIQINQIKILN